MRIEAVFLFPVRNNLNWGLLCSEILYGFWKKDEKFAEVDVCRWEFNSVLMFEEEENGYQRMQSVSRNF